MKNKKNIDILILVILRENCKATILLGIVTIKK